MELQAIAAVILGGTSIYGGSGAVWRSIAGVEKCPCAATPASWHFGSVFSQHVDAPAAEHKKQQTLHVFLVVPVIN